MWSSTALDDPGRAEQWLRLDWETPRNLRTVHLVFDDDVDEYLNNRRRHRVHHLDEDGLRGVRSLRVRVDAAHGARHALVVAVRVY
ncbi:hypothetical protein [Streptomyces mutabilis]|uniref:F5/8 type C domain-containing protein n=1 Tax=Streptomyces mutabilis TaxID=67332 RepID=A0A086MUF4_9ACTN|nr:hypothetical protein [Streptomyces mutabilis]KFG72522.1 hypothetical protein FM21_16560 [Streptomyces mutabilis]